MHTLEGSSAVKTHAKDRRGDYARNRGFGLASWSRGLAFPEEDYRPKLSRTGVPRGGYCRPRCPTRLPMGWHRPFYTRFMGTVRVASCEFPPASDEDPKRETAGSDSHYAPEAWCSRKAIPQAQSAVDRCFQTGTLQTQMPDAASDGLAPSFLTIFGAEDISWVPAFAVRVRNRLEEAGSADTVSLSLLVSRTAGSASPSFRQQMRRGPEARIRGFGVQ